jgi:branched-chain amino acid transport system permease protein
MVLISLYAILGLSINLVLGYCGLLSLCHGAFYAMGAYVYTILVTRMNLSFFPAAIAAISFSGMFSLLVGFPALRLKGDYFVLATMGFQIIVSSVLNNWVGVTQGAYGIAGIPKPVICGWAVTSVRDFVVLSVALACLVGFFHWQFTRSPYGRALRTVRDDELAAISLGKNAFYLKSGAFVVSGALAAISGVLFAGYITYIGPTSFGLEEAIFIVTVVVIGGPGTLKGPILGAAFVVLLPEVLRFCQVPDSIGPQLRQIVYGVLLILAMRYRPQGIAGHYAFD